GRDAEPAFAVRLHWSGAPGAGRFELGSAAQQGPGMGLAERPVPAGAGAGGGALSVADRTLRARNQDREPGGQFPAAGRPQLHRLLYHHFLRLWRIVRRFDVAARPLADAVWLRRLRFGPCDVAFGIGSVL